MADPERIFHQSLRKFQHIEIYANAVNDHSVPYVTAAIDVSDPFLDQASGIEVDLDEEYPCLIRDYTIPSTPPKVASPAILSAEWFRKLAPRPVLPPVLQLRFPLNIAVYILLPILIPLFMSFYIFRLSRASKASRARIKQLEQESLTAGHERLIDILAELEIEVEEALIDNPIPSSYQPKGSSRVQPILTPSHKKIVNYLNLLPIKKNLAYFPGVRNSHGMIVCRDVQQFEFHRKGEGLIRHWANSFIL